MTWSPESWTRRPAAQQPSWPNPDEYERACKELSTRPPLVFAGEARRLTDDLARVVRGEAVLLQAGDCAESFDSFSADAIRDKLKVILQMAAVLIYSSGLPVIKVGRIAGQFAKPRSADTESREGTELPSFRGHIVNDTTFDAVSRAANPARMLQAYDQSAATLNLLRAFTRGGFADLRQVHGWNQAFVAASPEGRRYDAVADGIDAALRFMAACGVDLDNDAMQQVDLYTSHEALLLGYEQALTRCDSLTGDFYDCSAHMLWIGERTRQVDGAHVEFLRGVHNPVGCKLGPSTSPDEAVAICEALNPGRIPGRLTLVARMGADRVGDALPPVVEAVEAGGHPVLWASDPMHGNTFTTDDGHKTRRLDDVLAELEAFFAVHHGLGTWPGGVHLELTGDDVTECLGGSSETVEPDLGVRYESVCDPRLNARQALDVAFRVAEHLVRGRTT